MKKPLSITYEFVFPDSHTRTYTIRIDRERLLLVGDSEAEPCEWARLDYHQCGHCPLTKDTSPSCPIASAIWQLVLFFKDEISYKRCSVRVLTDQRAYMQEVSVQEGLYSILGLVMATSGCPHMTFLKPMAYFHLPFSSVEETIVRAISLYLLKQYFVWKRRGGSPDWNLENLEQHYENVRMVNEGTLKRIRSLTKKGDADLNAVVILDDFASMLNLEISQGLEEYESIFLDTPADRA